MCKVIVSTLTAAFIATLMMYPTPATAVDAKAVLDACDRTKGCEYAASKDGSIQGCSSQSGVCFDCPADGKRQCNKTFTKPGKGKKGKTATGASDNVKSTLSGSSKGGAAITRPVGGGAAAVKAGSTEPKSTRRPGTTPPNLSGGQAQQPRGDGRVQTPDQGNPQRKTGVVRDHRDGNGGKGKK